MAATQKEVNTKRFRVVSLGNINCGDGFEINDAHYTGLEVTPKDLSVKGVMQALKDIGYLKKRLRFCGYHFDEDYFDRTLTLRRKRDGYWVVQLELIDDGTNSV